MVKIVTVGGGTGSYTVLSGLKNLKDVSLTALVSMADDGGSTGVLRDELGALPPGDVRQCLVALSEHSEIVRNLINYRFSEGKLSGHSFGNIFLSALEKVTGDFSEGVEIASEILKVNGKVVPITREKAELSVACVNGDIILGQVNVDSANLQDDNFKEIFYKNKVRLNENAKRAILEADYIIVGPGNYYCSVVPNLIVFGFREALGEAKAKIIFPVNLTNKNGHTSGWKVSDYIENIEKYLGKKVDFVLVNHELPSPEQVKRYKLEEGDKVLVEDDSKDPRIIRESLISHTLVTFSENDTRRHARSLIRHDPAKIAACIDNLIKK